MKRFALATFAVAALHPHVHAADSDPAPTPAPAPAPKPWKGFRVASDDGAYQLKLGGQLQVDAVGFVGDDDKAYTDDIRIRRARLNVRATVAKHYDFRFLIDTAGSTLSLLDAVVETTFLEELRLRVGKEKSPVGWDRLQSDTSSHFLEKSQTSTLVPNRDIGLQLVGKIGGGLVDYQLGLWDGTFDGATNEGNADDHWDVAGRVTFQPFVKSDSVALKDLQLGVFGSFGDAVGTQTAPQLAAYRSSGRATWFRYLGGSDLATTVIADGSRVRLGGHLNWQIGPFGLFGEAVQSSQEVRLGDTTGTVSNFAYTAQAAFVLAGGDYAWNGTRPEHDFDPGAGGAGAFELALRWTALSIDDAAFDDGFADATKSAKGVSALAVGVNWYLNAWVKLQLHYERTAFDGGAGTEDKPVENFVGARTQLLF